MTKEKHSKKCIEVLGEPFDYVHDWLDEFADGTYSHRRYRHHEDGIEYVRQKWGTRAAIAARIHIEQDWGHVPLRIAYDDIKLLKLIYYSLRGFDIPKNI